MKKKGLLLGVCGLTLGLLVGCGSSGVQKEFNQEMDTMFVDDANQIDYEFWLDDMTISDADAYTNMIVTQLKDMKLSGNIRIDEKNEAVGATISVDVLGETIPVEMIWSADGYYISTSFISSVESLATSLGESIELDDETVAGLEGKYYLVDEDEFYSLTYTDLPAFDFEDFRPVTSDVSWSDSVMGGYIETLDKETFTKDGDIISHTFTMDEIKAMASYVEKNTVEEDQASAKEFAQEVTEMLKDFDDLSIEVKLDTKKKSATLNFSMKMKDAEDTMKFGMLVKTEKTDVTIEMPASDKLVTTEQLQELVYGSSTAYTLSDEEFDEFLTEIKDATDYMTTEEIREYLDEVEDYLTEDQKKQIDDVLK